MIIAHNNFSNLIFCFQDDLKQQKIALLWTYLLFTYIIPLFSWSYVFEAHSSQTVLTKLIFISLTLLINTPLSQCG